MSSSIIVKERKISIQEMVLVGMFAAFLAVISQIAIPMPAGVPVTIQVFAVALIGAVMGWKLGALSVLVYILIGAVGAPVFAGFQGGVGVIAGTAGGYIIAWPVMTILCGIRPKIEHEKSNLMVSIILALIGLMICESVGGLQWALLTEGNWKVIMIYSFTAFIPKDIVLTVLAVILGKKIRGILKKVMP